MRKVKKQSGFTLVEIAIVLVVIGLLLGGVLKGQELIESSRIKGMAKDLNGYSTIFMAYQDRYRGLPGDDSTAAVDAAAGVIAAPASYAARGWGTYAASTAVGDGLVGAATALTTPAKFLAPDGENLLAIQALRMGGYLTGDGTSKIPPANAVGGVIGFTNTVMGPDWAGVNVVCYTGLNGKQASAIDRLLDDGVYITGSVRSSSPITTTVATLAATVASGDAPYSETTTGVTLCKKL
jgi:prepilin-type N-terminal cleavage/methylation domain-containing protein